MRPPVSWSGEYNGGLSAGERIIAVDSSSGYPYSRKKTLKKAFIALAETAKTADEQKENYAQRQQTVEDAIHQKTEEESKRRQTAIAEKQAKKKAAAEAKKTQTAAQKQRRQAKAAAKPRKIMQAKKEAQRAGSTH